MGDELVMVSKLTDAQITVLEALVEGKSPKEAAAEIGVTPITINNWLVRDPNFSSAFRVMRRARLENAIHGARLEAGLDMVMDTLKSVMEGDNPNASLRAASQWYEMYTKYVEQFGMSSQLQEMQEQINELLHGTRVPEVQQVFEELPDKGEVHDAEFATGVPDACEGLGIDGVLEECIQEGICAADESVGPPSPAEGADGERRESDAG